MVQYIREIRIFNRVIINNMTLVNVFFLKMTGRHQNLKKFQTVFSASFSPLSLYFSKTSLKLLVITRDTREKVVKKSCWNTVKKGLLYYAIFLVLTSFWESENKRLYQTAVQSINENTLLPLWLAWKTWQMAAIIKRSFLMVRKFFCKVLQNYRQKWLDLPPSKRN